MISENKYEKSHIKAWQDRFLDQLSFPQSGCWEWLGTKNHGYGIIQIDKKPILVHRLSYGLFIECVGELHVCHKCDNPPCCNPDHLFLGSFDDNMNDKVMKGRHTKGSKQWCSKLSDDDIRFIRQSELSQIELAKKFNVSNGMIWRIKHRRNWKHI